MECNLLDGGPAPISSVVDDLCWINSNTLIALWSSENGNKVLKVTIDTQTKTCQVTQIDSGYWSWRVSCSPSGEAYVTDTYRNKVIVYDSDRISGSGGLKTEWEPQGVRAPRTVAMNKEKFAVTGRFTTSAHFFDKDRAALNEINLNEKDYTRYMHLTDSGLLLVTSDSHELIIHNLKTKETITVDGEIGADGKTKHLYGVSSSPGDYILVCDFNNKKVIVNSPDGSLIHYLQIEGIGQFEPHAIAVNAQPGKPSLLALDRYNTVGIYTLSP